MVTRRIIAILALVVAGCVDTRATQDAIGESPSTAASSSPARATAPVPAVPAKPVHASIIPVQPTGPAGSCDAGAGKVCGTYPTSIGLTGSPSGRVTVLEGNGDGGYRFADASFYAGQIDAATASPLQGNGTAAHPIGETLCDAGEWHLMSGGAYVCGKVSGGSTYTGVSPIYVDASSSTIGIGTVSLEAGVSVTPKLQESRLAPCASTGQGIYEGAGTMACGALSLGTSAAVSGQLPVANGGTGAAPTCTAGQDVVATSGTAFGCVSNSGDFTCSSVTPGLCTVSQLQGGEITANATTGALTCAAGATACGRAQANTANVTPATMLDTPQASTNAAGVGGSYTVNLPNPGTGNYGGWTLEQGGTGIIRFGLPPNPIYSVYSGFWLGATAAAPTVFNMAISENGSSLQLSDPNELDLEYNGNYAVRILSGNTLSYTGQNLSVNVGSVATANSLFNGAVGALGILNDTCPTGAPSGGAVLCAISGGLVVAPAGASSAQFGVSSSSTSIAGYLAQSGTVPSTCTAGNYCTGGSTGDLYGRGGGSTVTETHIAPQGDAFSYLDYGTILRTGSIAASGGTGLVTWPVPIGYVCWMHIVAVGNYSSGTAGTASDIYTVYRNSAGTVSKVGILGSAANPIQNVGTSGAVADTHFNTASSGPIGTGSTSGSAGSVQITVTNQASSTANAFEVFVDAKCSSG